MLAPTNTAYATTTIADLDCDTVTTSDEPPSPLQIMCPVVKLVNVAVVLVGVVFVVIAIIGGIKMSLALGDPKGWETGRGTWQYLIIGSLIVVGFYIFTSIMLNLLGIAAFPRATDIFNSITQFIEQLLGEIGITIT